MSVEGKYDVAIIGGGPGGLTAARLLAMAGHSVALFEKKSYPLHRVCGEYISNESRPALIQLGVDPEKLGCPEITRFRLSSAQGKSVVTDLPLGGFGLSRYRLDYELANLCFESGVDMWEKTTVKNVSYNFNQHLIETSQGDFTARVVLGSFGKRSGLDKELDRDFVKKDPLPSKHFIGVKYHVKASVPASDIELHVFDKGYCGISKVEDDRYCMCYLTTAENLRMHGSIAAMEKGSLYSNPILAAYFESFTSLYSAPQVISQISFAQKTVVDQHMLMIGDAAALITPLAGNGISMAIHSAVLATPRVSWFLQGRISRKEMEDQYKAEWFKTFRPRIRTGKFLQSIFLNPTALNPVITLLKRSPALTRKVVAATHGKPFELPPSLRAMERLSERKAV